MRLIWYILMALLVLAAACGSDDTQSESIGQSAAEATDSALATSIARQAQSTPMPTATALVLSSNQPTATPSLAPIAQAAIETASGAESTATTTPLPQPTATASTLPSTDVPTALPTNTIAETPSPTVVALAEALPSDLRGDHFWLARPFFGNEDIRDYGEATYRFGSTGNGRYQPHHGLDIGNPHGTIVLAAASGEVLFAGDDFDVQVFGPSSNFYGLHVVLKHTVPLPDSGKNFTFYTLYGHLSELFVETGQTVNQYDEIGAVGQTGVAIGPHLHLEVRIGNVYEYTSVYNPDLWLQPWNGFGVLAGRASTTSGELLREVEVQVVALGRDRTYRTFTYVNEDMQSDPFYRENFVLPDLPAGDYEVRVAYRGRVAYRRQVTINPEQTTFINVQVE
jgi:murein DD-endopeptidase MepM/ murein hydrolase activator NlpD